MKKTILAAVLALAALPFASYAEDNWLTVWDNEFHRCDTNAEGTVTIPKGVTYIQQYAFANCDNVTSVVIPEGVKGIKENTFDSCVRLTSVTIPASVTYIEKEAFIYCGRLATINYGGTKVQWADVNKGDDWHRYVPETAVVKCSDGEVELDYIE